MTYAQRIHNRLANIHRGDSTAREQCTAIAAEADAEIAQLRAELQAARARPKPSAFDTLPDDYECPY